MPKALSILAATLIVALTGVACSSGGGDEQLVRIVTATPRPASSPAPTRTAIPSTAAAATPAPSEGPTFEPSPIPPVETPTAAAEPEPTPVEAPQIQLSSPELGQGQWVTIRLWNYSAVSAMAVFLDRRYPLVADGEFFWAVLTCPADQAPGSYPVFVQLFQENGQLLGELSTQVSVVDMGYSVEYIDLPPESTALLTAEMAQEEENIRANVFQYFTPQRLWVGPFIYPTGGGIASYYGTGRSYNGGPVTSYHGGVDLGAAEGDAVAASNSGRVAYAGPAPIRGNSVIIDHGVGVFTGYHHLSAIFVQPGQMVNKGDLVGYVGSTGLVTGPHLHWEVIIRGMVADPLLWTLEEIGF